MQKIFWRTYKMLTLTKSSCFTILFFLSKLIGTRETGNPSAQSKTETLLPKVQTGNPQYTFVWFSSRGLTVFGSQRIDFIQSKPVLDFQPLANQLFSFTCNFEKKFCTKDTSLFLERKNILQSDPLETGPLFSVSIIHVWTEKMVSVTPL